MASEKKKKLNANKSDMKNKFYSGNTKLKNFLNEKSDEVEQKISLSEFKNIGLKNFYENEFLIEVQKKVIQEINTELIKNINNHSELIKELRILMNDICNKYYPTLPNKDRIILLKSIFYEFTGLGPIQELIIDNSVSEIMVNGYKQVYAEKKGQLTLTNIRFRDNEHVMKIIDKIISPLGRRVDESSPMVDARLSDGSRVNVIIPPLSLIGPTITIRKFSPIPLVINDLISYGTLNDKMAEFIKMAVKAKCNIIVAGGTGSGKTTFLNVMSRFINENERIITIEDAAELRLSQPHIVSLESRPSNIEGKGEITIRDLLRNSLRMRPNRIIVGEVRGAETLDMLQAMNTGHNGSMSSVHANSPRDALSRLETMVLYTGIDFPLKAVREQVSSAIDLIIYLERFPDGSRKVTNITEVLGLETNMILIQNIFYFEKRGKAGGKIVGNFKAASIRPRVVDKFEALGLKNYGW